MKWILTLCLFVTAAFAPQPHLLFRQEGGTCQVQEWAQVACIRVSLHPEVLQNSKAVNFDVPGGKLQMVLDEHFSIPAYSVWHGHLTGHPLINFALIHFADGSWLFQEVPQTHIVFSYHLVRDHAGYDMVKIRCGG